MIKFSVKTSIYDFQNLYFNMVTFGYIAFFKYTKNVYEVLI